MNPLVVLVPVGVGLAALALGGRGGSRAKGGDGSTGGGGANRALLEQLAAKAEAVSGIRDLRTFAVVVALRESGWNPNAKNTTTSEAAAACVGFERNRDTRFKNNPWRNDPSRWCWGSGGWFGFLPSTALGRKGFENLDPRSVTDPEASVAYFAAFVSSVISGYFDDLPPHRRNWLSIRQSMASLSTMLNPDGQTAKKVEERLKKNLKTIGVDPSWMYSPITRLKEYPGNTAMLEAMKG